MQYVTRGSIDSVIEKLSKNKTFIAVDTETTGLLYKDRLFALQMYDGEEGYYFNFNSNQDAERKYAPVILNKHETFAKLAPLLQNQKIKFVAHNAKFDLMMIEKEGLNFTAPLYCTASMARILNNTIESVSLEHCCKFHNLSVRKNTEVKKYITKNKLLKKVYIPGKKKAIVEMHFDLVCHDLMFEYGIDDVKACYELAKLLYSRILSQAATKPTANNERKLIRTLSDAQLRGICVDMPYIKEASKYEQERIASTKEEISKLAEKRYVAGPKWLETVFKEKGYACEYTPHGSLSTSKSSLIRYNNPISRHILRLHDYQKNLGTYYSSYEYFAEKDHNENFVIRCDLNQSGTATGRFSSRNPNLQNITKAKESEKYSVRRCFIPRDGYVFVAIDYDQQEFRMLLDRAGEHEMIKKIMQDGLDVHTATSELTGVPRQQAKVINFGLLYGMGPQLLSKELNITTTEAMELIQQYFSALPNVKAWMNSAKRLARTNNVHNWGGRPLKDMGKNNFRMPNYLIQGGCGDVIKFAMNRISEHLQYKKSAMLLQIHDEIIFEVHETEAYLIPHLKFIMEDSYTPRSGMKLTCSTAYSKVSLCKRDMIEGEFN